MEQTIQQLIDQGKSTFDQKKYQEAFTELSRAIFSIEEKASSLDTVITEEYTIAEVYVMRGISLLMLDNQAAYTDPDIFHQITDDYDHAIDLNPEEPDYLYLRGQMHLHATFESYLEEAEEDFQAALKLDEHHFSSLKGNRGNLHEAGTVCQSH